jgi:hypothetical protein
VLALGSLAAVAIVTPETIADFVHARALKAPDELTASLNPAEKSSIASMLTLKANSTASDSSITEALAAMNKDAYRSALFSAHLSEDAMFHTGWDVFKHQIPLWLFFIVTGVITVLCWRKNLSLIPVLGLISCLYLMSELGWTNWMRFLIWLTVGLVIYFTYSRRHSHLATRKA